MTIVDSLLESIGYKKDNPLRMVIMGPPGAGKGTQAPKIKQKFCICHLATGDMLRKNVDLDTELGRQAKKIMEAGGLVPDNIMVNMIENELKNNKECKKGFILDGFPRTVNQAEQLDKMLERKHQKLSHCIELKINDNLLVSRILGRLVHPSSGRSYHIEFNPPKKPYTDDITNEPLIHRTDDNQLTLKKRLLSYRKQTEPVLEYYEKKGIVSRVDASQAPSVVWESLMAILSK